MRTRQASKGKPPGGADDLRRIDELFSESASEAIHAFFVAPKKESDLQLQLLAQDESERAPQERGWIHLIKALSPDSPEKVPISTDDERLFVSIFDIVMNHLAAARNVLSSSDFRVLVMLEVLALALGNHIVQST